MKYKGSIRKRLISIIMLVTILTGSIGYTAFVYWYMSNQYNNTLKLSKSIGLVLSQDIAKLVLLNDISAASDIITKLKSFSALKSMVLYKLNGEPILQYNKADKTFSVDKLPDEKHRDSIIKGRDLKLYVKANYQNTNLGHIQFNFKIDTVYDVIKKDIEALFVILFIIVFSSYLLAIYFAKKFTNPILNLVSFLEKIYLTESLTNRIKIEENNEYGKLYDEVNTMLERIEKSHDELKIAAVAFETQSGMLITDKNQKILRVNKAFTKITGYSIDEVVGKTPSILKSGIHNDKFYQNMYSSLGKNLFWIGEINNRHKDGSIVNELLTIHAILDNDDQVIYYVSSFLDITAQKKAEKELKQKESLLVQQSKMAAMGEMLENIAHQWRQPLSLISTTSSGLLLRKSMDIEIPEEEEKKDLEKIGDTVKYLSETIDDFRNYFKPNKSKNLFDIKECYEKAFKLLQPKFKSLDIKVIENLQSIEILGFENEFIQVIMNLLNNAKDVLEDKDVENKLIFIDIYKQNDKAVFSIKDNGRGINKDIINRVFEPYFTTKEESNGTGIGLYMSKEMVEKHMEGKLKVKNETYTYENSEYKGACFKVYLPL
ncbi:ATP-binding protein [Halarcobacter anaerophilus]|uniref:ATP-binding protein n=1 Tax=Halarcobacter anaerophilus TaxID=877500 RepID=UPI000696B571|nr:ATP-binding protein [Halarcobacter anaerophilus]